MMPTLEASLALLLAVPLYLNILLLRGRVGSDPSDETPRPDRTGVGDPLAHSGSPPMQKRTTSTR